jgi:hypothetical protein
LPSSALARIELTLRVPDGGGAELSISDEGPPERRSVVLELLADRTASLNGRFTSEARWPRGSAIRVELPPPRRVARIAGVGETNGSGGYLLFVWSPAGYRLVEQQGEPPLVGSEVEDGERRYRITKIAPSPLPGDARPCLYLLPS